MATWEYLVLTINTEYEIDQSGEINHSPDGDQILQQRLSDCGAEGWELVGFLPAAARPHFKGNPENPWLVWAVFKRVTESA